MKRWLIIALTVPFLICATTSSTKVKFYKGSLSTAKENAAHQGKLVFVEFVASWCMPCRWMDEYTFTNPQLAQYLARHYIPVKVDIDDFDGYAYKQMYNVKMLPSMLILDAKGKVLAQYAESMAPSTLLTILKKHNTPANKHTNTYQPQTPENQPLTPNTTASPDTYHEQPVQVETAATDKADKQIAAAAAPTNTPYTHPAAANQGLFRFSVSRQASTGFSVQIGAFGQYGNVLRETEKLEKQYQQPVIVHISSLKGKTVYKVMLGEFDSRPLAMRFLQKMKLKGMQGIVKDLSTIR